jgi:PTS system galactosamine-specific IID component
MESKKVLTKKDINKLALRSVFLQASFSYERMQAGGWTYAMLPFLKKIHKDDKAALSESMQYNMEFINTNPWTSGFLMGLVLSLEENKEDKNLIKSLKAGLFGPLAGLGDAIFWFTVLPIVAGISASFAKSGSILGPLFFFICYCIVFSSRFLWTNMGYKLGTSAIETIQKSSQLISRSASILGITVLGGLIPSYVNLHVVKTFTISAGHKFSIQHDFLDHIFPNILPLAYTLLIFYLLKKKKMNPVLLIFLTIVLAIVGSYFGILG